MGQDIDKPVTVWDDMFLPSEVGLCISNFQYTGADGVTRPLVSTVETLNRAAGRPQVLDVPRLQWPRMLVASVLFSGIIVLLYVFLREKKGFGIFTGLLHSSLGLFFGITGSMLFFMTFISDHDYCYHNINILFINPLLLAAIPLGLIFGFTKIKKRRFVAARLLRALWSYVFLGGLLTVAVKLSPSFFQQNQVDLALVMPIAVTMVFIMAKINKS
jgi:hypothetical protein